MSTSPAHADLPPVHQVAMTRPVAWLALGWRDMWRCGPLSLLHGMAMMGFGALIAWFAHDQFWWLAGAFSGFMVVAPVLATSLYALSRAIERGDPADLALVQRTWLNWQRSHRNKWGNDYWCLVQFGSLLGASATGWVLTSAALIMLLVVFGLATLLLGLVVVMPVLGHASWHAYRDLVDVSGLPERNALTDVAEGH